PLVAERRMHRQSRAPPDTRLALVDAHGADHRIGRACDERLRDGELRLLVDRIAVVADEDALLDTEHRAPQGHRAGALPAGRGRAPAPRLRRPTGSARPAPWPCPA